MSNYKNIAKAKAIEKSNKQRLLKVNPKLDDESGIYFLTRTDEDNISYFYKKLVYELQGNRGKE